MDNLTTWQNGKAWRKLPYVKATWDGPQGRTAYLADRDYRAIAYRAPDGRWLPAMGQTLRGHAMLDAGEYTYCPARTGTPRDHRNILADLVQRCARHPSTAWILKEVQQ